MQKTREFIEMVQHPIRFRFFLLKSLPAAFFSRVRIRYLDEEKALITVPYRWFTKNPFQSTYFACLSMAAEMSTGLLVMAYTWKQDPPIRMLVAKTEAVFLKKATGITVFTCEDGKLLEQAVREAAASGKSVQFPARSVGKDAGGEVVAEFTITWSLKVKNSGEPIRPLAG